MDSKTSLGGSQVLNSKFIIERASPIPLVRKSDRDQDSTPVFIVNPYNSSPSTYQNPKLHSLRSSTGLKFPIKTF